MAEPLDLKSAWLEDLKAMAADGVPGAQAEIDRRVRGFGEWKRQQDAENHKGRQK